MNNNLFGDIDFDLFQSAFIRFIRSQRFNKKAQIRFLQTLERLTRFVALPTAIKHMLSCTVGVQVEVLHAMQDRTRRGENAMEAVFDWFPPDIASALYVGETQNINAALKSALEVLQSPTSNVLKPFRWILYPVLLLGMGLGLCKFINNAILSEFSAIIETSPDIPSEFTYVIGVSNFVGIPLLITLVLCATLVVLINLTLKNFVSEMRFSLDKYPIFSAYRDISAINFLRLFSNLLFMGITNLKALELINSNSKNKYLKEHLRKMAATLGDGGSIGQAFNTGLIDAKDVSTIKILSSSRGTGYYEAIVGATEISLDRLETKLRNYSFVIGGVICLITMDVVLNAVSVLLSLDTLFIQ